MIFNTSGGGVSLNFKVVDGTSTPSNPKKNTIWVNTDVPITSWEFNMFSVVNPFEGLVWLGIGNTGNIEFNALKKNGILVRPLFAKQYVNGAWVDKPAKIYQNGAWVDFYNRDERIALLNATGWARFSENTAGEYVRFQDRGFTRNSVLPAIWCWFSNDQYCGFCILAAQESALATISETDYGSVTKNTTKTPKGNTVYVGYMGNAWGNDSTQNIVVTSNGNNYNILNQYKSIHCYNPKTDVLSDELGKWVDELLFGVR